jgi:hypothetical protein
MELVDLNIEHLETLLSGAPELLHHQLQRAYFSPGSVACCLLVEGEPVFAGGIVNLQWGRGEVWILPTPFFKSHVKTCFRKMRERLPKMVEDGRFVRIQATCVKGTSAAWLRVFEFVFEGTLKKFGPNGETCDMYARIFEP